MMRTETTTSFEKDFTKKDADVEVSKLDTDDELPF